jgi:predicted nucleic acid-binding protein
MSIRAAFDSNILVYAALEPASPKGLAAANLVRLATPYGVLAVQALLEFVAVVGRRAPHFTAKAAQQAQAWAAVFETAATTSLVMDAALKLITKNQFQMWDAVIFAASQAAGATVLFSADLQVGFSLDGLGVVNPFLRTDAELLALLNA